MYFVGLRYYSFRKAGGIKGKYHGIGGVASSVTNTFSKLGSKKKAVPTTALNSEKKLQITEGLLIPDGPQGQPDVHLQMEET